MATKKEKVDFKKFSSRDIFVKDSNLFISNSYYQLTAYVRNNLKSVSNICSLSPVVRECIDTLISTSLAKKPDFIIDSDKSIQGLLLKALNKVIDNDFLKKLNKFVEYYYVFGGAYFLIKKSNKGIVSHVLRPFDVWEHDKIKNCYLYRISRSIDDSDYYIIHNQELYLSNCHGDNKGKLKGKTPFISNPLVSVYNSCRAYNENYNLSPLYTYIDELTQLNELYARRPTILRKLGQILGFTNAANHDVTKTLIESNLTIQFEQLEMIADNNKPAYELLDKAPFIEAAQEIQQQINSLEQRIKDGLGITAIENMSEPVANQSATSAVIQANMSIIKLKHHLARIELAIGEIYQVALDSLKDNYSFLQAINGKELSKEQIRALQQDITIKVGNINYFDANLKQKQDVENISLIQNEFLGVVGSLTANQTGLPDASTVGPDLSTTYEALEFIELKANILNLPKEALEIINKRKDIVRKTLVHQEKSAKDIVASMAAPEPTEEELRQQQLIEEQQVKQAQLANATQQASIENLHLKNIKLRNDIKASQKELEIKERKLNIDEREQDIQDAVASRKQLETIDKLRREGAI